MTHPPSHTVTNLLHAAESGEPEAREILLSAIYNELRAMASAQLAHEPKGSTLNATALVHEAYLRLFGGHSAQWQNRRHFFSAFAEAMRRICIDRARMRKQLKRGGGKRIIPLYENAIAFNEHNRVDLLALDEALTALERVYPREAEVVKLRFFACLSVDETANVMSLSPRSVAHDWQLALAWLRRELSKD